MIKNSDGDVFETMRSLRQDLTFDETEKAFARYGVAFGEDKFIALGLRNIHDDQYTIWPFCCPTSASIPSR